MAREPHPSLTACPPGRLGEGPLVGHLDGCRAQSIQDAERTPRSRDHAVLLGDLRGSDLNDDAVLGLLDVVVLTGDDQDAVAPGLNVLLAQLVDGNFHAAGDRPDEVGELGDTKSVGHQSSLLRHVKGGGSQLWHRRLGPGVAGRAGKAADMAVPRRANSSGAQQKVVGGSGLVG